MKLQKILDSRKSLEKLYALDTISSVTSYKVKMIINQINPNLDAFAEQFEKLNKKYYGEGENRKRLNPDEIKVVQKEIEELTDVNVPLKIKKVKLYLNESIKGLSALDLENLAPFVDIVLPEDAEQSEEIEL